MWTSASPMIVLLAPTPTARIISAGSLTPTPTASTVSALWIDLILAHDWSINDKFLLIPVFDHSHRSAGTKYGVPLKTRSGVPDNIDQHEPHCGCRFMQPVCEL
jgi:hypothetical protein